MVGVYKHLCEGTNYRNTHGHFKLKYEMNDDAMRIYYVPTNCQCYVLHRTSLLVRVNKIMGMFFEHNFLIDLLGTHTDMILKP